MKMLRFERRAKCLAVVTGMLFCTAYPAVAQISYKAVEKHEQLKRQSLREASQTKATNYKDTHLNMDAYTFKKGESGKADNRPLLQVFSSKSDAPREAVQRAPADREKRKFRLFRKKEK